MKLFRQLLLALSIIWSPCLLAQESSMSVLPLKDLSAFKSQAGNWQIVGEVTINPLVDVHESPESVQQPSSKKKKPASKSVKVAPKKALTFETGTGILLNINDAVKKDHLITVFEHGDIELEVEVMLPKGSNSGLYLQGRYEVQLFDSWGVKNPKYSDIGGIYRNWEMEPSRIYMGKAPSSNPSKAPGLWQKLRLLFRAPRFDASGQKIANARFDYVELNGVRIHENVALPLWTGGQIESNEKAMGPLMIQGDHGAVAFRNIRYRLMSEHEVSISPIDYRLYKGSFQDVASFVSLKPVKTGTVPQVTCQISDEDNNYGIVMSGTIIIPKDDEYEFQITSNGGVVLKIDGQVLIDFQRDDWGAHGKSIQLRAGIYPMEIYHYKASGWLAPRLRLGIRTPTTYLREFQSYNSYPPDDNPTSPIFIDAGSTPRLLRAFVDFKQNRGQRLTHTIGVGDPSGVNYVYDLGAGNLVGVWRGGFVDATPMWHERGDGSFRLRGAVQYTFLNQPLAYLSNPSEPFPVVANENSFRSKGYILDETGRPTFKYRYEGLEVEDKIYPDDHSRSITRELRVKDRGTREQLYFKLAEGNSISCVGDGYYQIDKQYYIKPSQEVVVREVSGKKELVTAVKDTVKYTIIW